MRTEDVKDVETQVFKTKVLARGISVDGVDQWAAWNIFLNALRKIKGEHPRDSSENPFGVKTA